MTTDLPMIDGKRPHLWPDDYGQYWINSDDGSSLNHLGQWIGAEYQRASDSYLFTWPTEAAAREFALECAGREAGDVSCPQCGGSGESGLVPMALKQFPPGNRLSDAEAKALAAEIALCSFCGGKKTVPAERIEWRAIGKQWWEARLKLKIGMRQWAEQIGCPPGDYCQMEAGHMKPDSRFSPLDTPAEVAHEPKGETGAGFQFTDAEYKAMVCDPEALRIVADWHEMQITMADAINDEGCFDTAIKAHEARQRELRKEADRIESTY